MAQPSFDPSETELGSLAIAEPADSCRQTLELDAPAREIDPAAQDMVVRKHFQNQIVGDGDVRGLAGKSDPAEGAAAFAEQRTNVGRNEAGEIVGILDTTLEGESAYVVAVVESHCTHLLQAQHAFNMAGHGIE